ncbi:MAG TPA: cell division protein FtsQ [Clostridiales bacterium]|nr:cell division protein FtsQ [Clostridiales bacterium]
MANRRNNKKNNNLGMRMLKRFLGFIILVGLPSVIFISTFQLKTVTVEGLTRYTNEEIQEKLIHTKFDKNALLLYLKYNYFTDVQIPFIEDIDLILVDNHQVKIKVYEKKVIGCVVFLGDYLYFDKDGIIVESMASPLDDVPLVKGLRFNKIILHEKLEVQKLELFDVILNLTQHIEKLDLDIDTIRFNSKYEVTFDIDEIRVYLGKRDTYDEILGELKNILKEVEGMELTLDMRKSDKNNNRIIAKPKEAESAD